MKTICYKDTLDICKIDQVLKSGGIIGFPTETVYGLGAYLSNEDAIKRIFELKKRAHNKPFIIHLASFEDVIKVAEDIPHQFYKLAKVFMPGPLTIVLKKKKNISSSISSSDTIAVRVPDHPLTLKLLKELREPIVGTSANISNETAAVTASEVLNIFDGKIQIVIDGGEAQLKLPSTVLSLIDGLKILRAGKITLEQINSVLKF